MSTCPGREGGFSPTPRMVAAILAQVALSPRPTFGSQRPYAFLDPGGPWPSACLPRCGGCIDSFSYPHVRVSHAPPTRRSTLLRAFSGYCVNCCSAAVLPTQFLSTAWAINCVRLQRKPAVVHMRAPGAVWTQSGQGLGACTASARTGRTLGIHSWGTRSALRSRPCWPKLYRTAPSNFPQQNIEIRALPGFLIIGGHAWNVRWECIPRGL